eukprot:Gb_39991 [translate_table: standard]
MASIVCLSTPPCVFLHQGKQNSGSSAQSKSPPGFCNHGSNLQVQGTIWSPLVRIGDALQCLKDANSLQAIVETIRHHSNEKEESENPKRLLLAGLAPAWALVDAPHALALTKYTDEEWGRIWIATGGVLFVYFLVMPPIVFNYLRLRWYKRNLPEAFFQFLLVFLFFPGMMLYAPFINFRRLPRDPSKKTPWS